MEPSESSDLLNNLVVVVPVYQDHYSLVRLLGIFEEYKEIEVVVVDCDNSHELKEVSSNVQLLKTTERGRGQQIAYGIEHSTRPWIWVLHADSTICTNHLNSVVKAFSMTGWGRFDVTLDGDRFIYRIVEALMNFRSKLTGICTGDQGIFFTRKILEHAGEFPKIPLMEDIELSKRLRSIERPACLRERLKTSARKWESDGPIHTIVKMWLYRLRYLMGESPAVLYSEYYPKNTK